MRNVRYLKGTIEVKLQLMGMVTEDEPPTLILEGYSDADYAANTHRKSVSGGVIFLNEMTVGWMCRKKVSVAPSTMESEFVAASLVASDLLELK